MTGHDTAGIRPQDIHWRDDDNPRVDDCFDQRKRELLGSDPNCWPPLVVAKDGEGYLGIDGFARWSVANELGLVAVNARVEPMPDDVRQRAFELNQHGFPLTLAQRRAHAAYLRERYKNRSDRDIARTCGLSPTTVGKLDAEPTQGRARPNRVVRHLERIAFDGIEWGEPREAADEVRRAIDDDELDEFAQELGLGALNALAIAEELGFEQEAPEAS